MGHPVHANNAAVHVASRHRCRATAEKLRALLADTDAEVVGYGAAARKGNTGTSLLDFAKVKPSVVAGRRMTTH